MQRRMRRMMVMIATLVVPASDRSLARSRTPTCIPRSRCTGPHETNLSPTGHDDYVSGDSDGHGFAAELEGAGFADVTYRTFAGGIVALHTGRAA